MPAHVSSLLDKALSLAKNVLSPAPDGARLEVRDVIALATSWVRLDRELRAGAAIPTAWCCAQSSRKRLPPTDHALQAGIGIAKRILSPIPQVVPAMDVIRMAELMVQLDLKLKGGAQLPRAWLAPAVGPSRSANPAPAAA